MRYYLDTEFLDRDAEIRMISIGIVCEDGRELYFINSSWLGDDGFPDTTGADDWLRTNVFAQLPPCRCTENATWRRGALDFPHDLSCRWRRTSDIARAVEQFIVDDGTKPEVWAYFASYDWVIFCHLFGRMLDLPKHFPFFVRCLKQYALDIGFTGKFKELLPNTGHHDALADAKWNRDVHALLEHNKAIGSEKLTFGALAVDDHFVGFPLPGDNAGYGGYLNGQRLFKKISEHEAHDGRGVPSSMPTSMHVLKVVLR